MLQSILDQYMVYHVHLSDSHEILQKVMMIPRMFLTSTELALTISINAFYQCSLTVPHHESHHLTRSGIQVTPIFPAAPPQHPCTSQ